MKNEIQKKAFFAYEADAWFERNRAYLDEYCSDQDEVCSLIKSYNLDPKMLLEIGCSAGARLNGLKSIYEDCSVFGIDPSQKAIAYGQGKFDNVKLRTGSADNLKDYADYSMDIVVVGFVFYVVDRALLFKTISEIDRVLKDKGHVVIVDFFSQKPMRKKYQHIKTSNAYSFKQNYSEIFTSSMLYHLIDKSCFDHDTKIRSATGDYDNKFSISLLQKDLFASYR